jgi:putative transposase
MRQQTRRSGAHHAQSRARKQAKKRVAKAKVAKTARAARKSAGPEQAAFVDNRMPNKRRFKSGKKMGRPPKEGAGQRHETRPNVNPRLPLHVNTRVAKGLESLRSNEIFDLIRAAIGQSQEKFGLRVVAYSIQSNHLHMIVEADGSKLEPGPQDVPVLEMPRREELAKRALAKGMQGLLGSIAKKLNGLWDRTGTVFPERYHAVVIDNPLQMKRTIAYVLNNAFQHGSTLLRIDPYSSGSVFDGWEEAIELAGSLEEWSVAAPRTWLAREGWKRHGPIRFPVAA